MRVVGKPLPKVDAAMKVTGRAVYADDMMLPRTLHCRILRSPHPHARILAIDTSAARRMPGVLAVITGADLPIKFGILPVTQDERALEHEKVRYVGDPIAAVAATVFCEFCALKEKVYVPAAGTIALKPPFGSTDSVNPAVTLAALTVSG